MKRAKPISRPPPARGWSFTADQNPSGNSSSSVARAGKVMVLNCGLLRDSRRFLQRNRRDLGAAAHEKAAAAAIGPFLVDAWVPRPQNRSTTGPYGGRRVMWKALCTMALAVSAVDALAQGTIYFTATLTGNYGVDGSGTFSLITNRFRYDVQTPFGFSVAQMLSPWPDTNAVSIFDLVWIGCRTPSAPDPGACFFKGSLTLSDAQIADLTSGKWFVYSPNGPFFVEAQLPAAPAPSPPLLV